MFVYSCRPCEPAEIQAWPTYIYMLAGEIDGVHVTCKLPVSHAYTSAHAHVLKQQCLIHPYWLTYSAIKFVPLYIYWTYTHSILILGAST